MAKVKRERSRLLPGLRAGPSANRVDHRMPRLARVGPSLDAGIVAPVDRSVGRPRLKIAYAHAPANVAGALADIHLVHFVASPAFAASRALRSALSTFTIRARSSPVVWTGSWPLTVRVISRFSRFIGASEKGRVLGLVHQSKGTGSGKEFTRTH